METIIPSVTLGLLPSLMHFLYSMTSSGNVPLTWLYCSRVWFPWNCIGLLGLRYDTWQYYLIQFLYPISRIWKKEKYHRSKKIKCFLSLICVRVLFFFFFLHLILFEYHLFIPLISYWVFPNIFLLYYSINHKYFISHYLNWVMI